MHEIRRKTRKKFTFFSKCLAFVWLKIFWDLTERSDYLVHSTPSVAMVEQNLDFFLISFLLMPIHATHRSDVCAFFDPKNFNIHIRGGSRVFLRRGCIFKNLLTYFKVKQIDFLSSHFNRRKGVFSTKFSAPPANFWKNRPKRRF